MPEPISPPPMTPTLSMSVMRPSLPTGASQPTWGPGGRSRPPGQRSLCCWRA